MSCPPMSQMTSTSPKKCTDAQHVRDGLDDVHVALHALFEHVGRVAGRAEAHHLELGALIGDERLELREELLRVLDRVALRELVGLAEDLAVLVVDDDGLARRRAAVEADDGADLLARLERRRDELRDLVELAEVVELLLVLRERRTRGLTEARLAARR